MNELIYRILFVYELPKNEKHMHRHSDVPMRRSSIEYTGTQSFIFFFLIKVVHRKLSK
jgi:hypothetical protein